MSTFMAAIPNPLFFKMAAKLAVVIPFPNPEITPPDTKTYLAIGKINIGGSIAHCFLHLGNVPRREGVDGPVDGDLHLFLPGDQFGQVDRTPNPPGQTTGKAEGADFGNG